MREGRVLSIFLLRHRIGDAEVNCCFVVIVIVSLPLYYRDVHTIIYRGDHDRLCIARFEVISTRVGQQKPSSRPSSTTDVNGKLCRRFIILLLLLYRCNTPHECFGIPLRLLNTTGVCVRVCLRHNVIVYIILSNGPSAIFCKILNEVSALGPDA